MYLAILLLPFLGAAFAGLRGRAIGTTGAQIVTTGCITLTAVLAMVAFYEVGLSGSPVSVELSSWLDAEPLHVSWAFLFDDLTVSMLLAVLIVSALVHLYSASYMADDPHGQRFFAYLSFFTASMVVLVTGDSYLVIFLGWEGIGIASFLLIGFWLTRVQANKAAVKALTVNRVGDASLSVGLFALLWTCGSLEYASVYSVTPLLNETAITVIALLLFGGAMSKSAQVPLHTWLPDAMEGPTPVSALIHAATLVTAGVYLMLRSSPLLEYGPTALVVITWVGALTAFFAATTGLVQSDLKRVIAYSTCSQLGYMFIAVGLSQYNVALLHLVGHAFFKALLFLAAGAVIHGMADQQDLRRLGGLVGFMPLTYTAILVGSLSLMALPWLTGFYSKDLLLELAYGRYVASGTLAYWLGTIAAACTAFYSFRLVSLAFFGVPNAPRGDYLHAHDAPLLIVVPLVLLSILAIGFGYVAKDLWVGPGTDFLSTALYQHPNHVALVEAEFAVPHNIKLLPAIVSIGAASLAVFIYHVIPSFAVNVTRSGVGLFLYRFLVGKWLFDVIVVGLVIKPALSLGHIISKVLDRGVIELVGPFGLTTGLTDTARLIARYDSGLVTSYALYMVLGILILFLYAYAPFVLGNIDAGENYGLILVFLTSLALLPNARTTTS